MPPVPESIVIIGGGIVGCSTAYYLTNTPQFQSGSIKVTLIEADAIACAASGYSGGFLARDWHATETADLGRLSFACHEELAALHDGASKWGYAQTTSLSLTARETCTPKTRDEFIGRGDSQWLDGVGGIRTRQGGKRDVEGIVPAAFDWINQRHITGVSEMDSATAQVNPLSMTRAITHEAARRGVEIVFGRAVKVTRNEADKVNGIRLHDGTCIACNKVLLAAGPWTGSLHDSLFPNAPKLPISSFAGTSLVLQHENDAVSPFAVFGSITMNDGEIVEIEFFGREQGQIWLGGINDYSSLPEAGQIVEPRPKDVAKLLRISKVLFPKANVVRVAKCHRPINDSGKRSKDVPIMKQVEEGVYVCAGHSVWGITLGPGSGLVMSRMMTDQALGCDISQLQQCR